MTTYAGTILDLGGAVFNALEPSTGITGDGTTDDAADLSTLANTTIPATGGRLVLPPGTYRLGSNVTLPAHVAVDFAPGAILKPDASVTVTLAGPVEAGAFRIFDLSASGSAIVLSGDAGPVRPEWFGAAGDGTGDDAGAINAASAAAGAGGEVLFSPGRTYRIGATISILSDGQVWRMDGVTIQVNFTGIGISVGRTDGRTRNARIYGGSVEHASARDWSAGAVGVRWVNCNAGQHVGFRITGFETGLLLLGTGSLGQAYTSFHPLSIRGCRQPIRLYAEDGGWCNENTFVGGSISYFSSDPGAAGYYAIHLSRQTSAPDPEDPVGSPLNNNKFFGVSLENAIAAGDPDPRPRAVYVNGVNNEFIALRYEGFPSPFITLEDGAGGDALTGGNVFAWGFGLGTPGATVDANNQFYQYIGPRASLLGGGSSAEPLLTLGEVNSGNNVTFRIRGTAQQSVFEVTGLGKTTIGPSGAAISRHLSATTTWDPPSVAAGGFASTTLPVASAVVGDTVSVGFSQAVPAGAVLSGAVTAAGTVTVTLLNATGAAVDLGSGTLRADVWQH